MTCIQLKKTEELARAVFALEEDELSPEDQKRPASHNLVRRMSRKS
ncbi:MAG: hypothetical protein QNJ29_00490 [Rhizobiaceae bacterium]|nr:hypothetical protein [Rhizobiaceae bacterium]